MSTSTLLLIIILGTVSAYFLGDSRSRQVARPMGGVRHLASLPSYYASMVSLWAIIPALLILVLWTVFDGAVIESLVRAVLPIETKSLPAQEFGLIMNQINNVASGVGSIDVIGREYARL